MFYCSVHSICDQCVLCMFYCGVCYITASVYPTCNCVSCVCFTMVCTSTTSLHQCSVFYYHVCYITMSVGLGLCRFYYGVHYISTSVFCVLLPCVLHHYSSVPVCVLLQCALCLYISVLCFTTMCMFYCRVYYITACINQCVLCMFSSVSYHCDINVSCVHFSSSASPAAENGQVNRWHWDQAKVVE